MLQFFISKHQKTESNRLVVIKVIKPKSRIKQKVIIVNTIRYLNLLLASDLKVMPQREVKTSHIVFRSFSG